MQVRLATPQDAPSIASLAVAFRNHLERSSPTDEQLGQSVLALCESTDAVFYVAIIENQVIGYVLQRYRHSMWANGTEATLEDLFVDPAFCNHGAGKALIKFALAQASQVGCTTVCLDTNEFNAASTRIYSDLGFTSQSKRWGGRQIFFRKNLDAIIRPLTPDDSIEVLTDLIHRAYAPLGAMGLNYTAVDQSAEITAQRASRGICFVAIRGREIIGTLVVQPPDPESECRYFSRPGVASVRQFAVAPERQGTGVGSNLLAKAESWARDQGYSEVAMDTAEPATHLVELYGRRGYLFVDWVQWPGKTYRSVVLSKSLACPP